MQPPMIGTWTVTLHAVQTQSIHGDLYYQLTFEPAEAPGNVLALRAPHHVFSTPPKPGDRLTLQFLMGQITAARPAEVQ